MAKGISGLALGLADSDSERGIKIHQGGGVIASIMSFEVSSHVCQLA
jgi:hypothetical protein